MYWTGISVLKCFFSGREWDRAFQQCCSRVPRALGEEGIPPSQMELPGSSSHPEAVSRQHKGWGRACWPRDPSAPQLMDSPAAGLWASGKIINKLRTWRFGGVKPSSGSKWVFSSSFFVDPQTSALACWGEKNEYLFLETRFIATEALYSQSN